MNLLRAIHAEHYQRTGHDIFTEWNLPTLSLRCDVCLYLDAEIKTKDEAGR